MTDIDRLRNAIRGNLAEQKKIRARIRRIRRSYNGAYKGPEWDAYLAKITYWEFILNDYKSCLAEDRAKYRSLTSLPE